MTTLNKTSQDYEEKSTTIKINKRTKSELDDIGKKNESYEKIIRKLIDENWENKKIINTFKDIELAEIFNEIRKIKKRDNEVAPDYFGELFFKIANITSIPKEDYLRYFEYAFNEFKRRCKLNEKSN